MIRINLLPVRAQKKRSKSLIQIAGMAATLCVAAAIGIGANMYYTDIAEKQQEKIDASKDEIKRLKKIIGEVNQLDKQKSRLLKQLSVIEKLERSKLGPVRVLDELSTYIPKRVWLKHFEEKGGSLTLKGVGLENSDISEFLRALQKSKYFKNVKLKYTQAQKSNGVSIFNFMITCGVNYAASS